MVDLLVPQKEYLSSGIHIGMKSRTKDMERFLYKVREDGLAVLNLRMLDERIRIAANFLAGHNNILVIGKKLNAHTPIKKFAEIVGADFIIGRFMPGTLTNPHYENFVEPDVVFLTDPLSDQQALKEADGCRIPIVALCDTFNETKKIDLIIPSNNKGKKSLALIYWLLAREIFKKRGQKDFKYTVENFSDEE